jgi:hypothetical protein
MSNNDKNFCCEYCDYKSNRRYNLTQHVVIKHIENEQDIIETPKVIVEDKKLCCEYCDYITYTESNLKQHIVIKHIENENIKKNNDIGWIYCIKSSENNIYKCGYTTKNGKLKCESYLRSRYGTILPNPEIIHLVNVSNAKIAEKDLFNKLKDIKYIREMYKTEDVSIIINAMNEINKKYNIDQVKQHPIIFNNEEDTYIKPKNIIKKLLRIAQTKNIKDIIKTYIREIFAIKENQNIIKINLNDSYSKVYIGDGNWINKLDTEIYPKLTNLFAISIFQLLYNNKIENKIAMDFLLYIGYNMNNISHETKKQLLL